MTALKHAKHHRNHHTAEVNGKKINFIFGDSPYGSFIRQWDIDGDDKCPVKCRYSGKPLTLACCNGGIGEREFNRSIKLEFLYEVIGWEDKIKEMEEKINQKMIAKVRETRPEAKVEDYDFAFYVGMELDGLLLEMAKRA